MYDIESFLREKELLDEHETVFKLIDSKPKLKIAYIRVSSIAQKDDLEGQKQEVLSHFPNHTLITDIGSGLNLNKRGIGLITSIKKSTLI